MDVLDAAVREGSYGKYSSLGEFVGAHPEARECVDEAVTGYRDAMARRDRAYREVVGSVASSRLIGAAVEVEKGAEVAQVWRTALRSAVKLVTQDFRKNT